MKKLYNVLLVFCLSTTAAYAQLPQQGSAPSLKAGETDLDYFAQKEYTIGGTSVTGTKYLDKEVLITLTKLTKGTKITLPGDATANAIKTLWNQGLFDDVKLKIARIEGDTVYFEIDVVERPRVAKLEIAGLNKSQRTALTDKFKDNTPKILNENTYNSTTTRIKDYMAEKGYYFADVKYTTRPDSAEENSVVLVANVNRGDKVRVSSIEFTGNKNFTPGQLRGFMKNTKQRAFYKIFGSKKFIRKKYEEDKVTLISKMHDKGYRDAVILSDTVYKVNSSNVGVKINLLEGKKYYFGNITWTGNSKYPDSFLSRVLAIKKGDVFSEERLNKKLNQDPNNGDINSIYTDDGYLTFQSEPVQTRVYNDTVDVTIRIIEGQQYTNNHITVKGNTITNDRVILRSLYTKPGEKFSKQNLIRSIREIGQLRTFNESKTVPTPRPNPADGTVDIEYAVEEKSSDQIELSAGFGGGNIVGTLGLTFNNFSLRNIFKGSEYRPLPRGDGQQLSLRAQTNGKFYQSYSLSFNEPWLGGYKPTNFGFSAFHSYNRIPISGNIYTTKTSPDDQIISMDGIGINLGKALNWPDNYFYWQHAINLQQFRLQNYTGYLFSDGKSYNFNWQETLQRDSRDNTFFPTSGSYLKFTMQLTPPYSLLNKVNYATASDAQRYRFSEYHKWKLEGQWFAKIIGKLVMKGQAQFGFLGSYNQAVGSSPFERFKLGGSGMMGFDFLQGSEIIAMRGYSDYNVVPASSTTSSEINTAVRSGSPIFVKYTLEARYPVIDTESAKAFILAFAEAGNTYNTFREFNPFTVRRVAGVGARVFLPIFGTLGIDYGIPFDKIPGVTGYGQQRVTFSIAQQLGGFN